MIKDLWYKNAVIYCLSVATYMDANGDGIGDFQGLMRRLAVSSDPVVMLEAALQEAAKAAGVGLVIEGDAMFIEP